MFNKLKKFKEMRSKAKSLQNSLSEEKVQVESRGISLTLDGNQKVVSLAISPSLKAQEIERILPDLFNDGVKKVQKIMVEKMKGMGGMDNFKF